MPAWGGELGVETVLAPPLTFQLRGGGTVADQSLAPMVLGQVPTGIPALGPELGTTKALPPVVTALYRARRGKALRPYVGVGASYLHTYDSQITNPILNEVAPPRLSIDDAFSAVGQLGLDVHLGGRFWATADVKAMSGFSTTARVENIVFKTPAFPLYESVYVGNVSVDVVVRPVIFMLGAGASF
jgi:outer membrane protein W